MLLLKRRPPSIDTARPTEVSPGFEHLDRGALTLLCWLSEKRVEFVLIGEVARALHTRSATRGPVAIVPAPHRRNVDRLATALNAADVRVHDQIMAGEVSPDTPWRVTVEELAGQKLWRFTCDGHHIDVVGTGAPAPNGAAGAAGYQELLYEATRFEPSPGVSLEVASPEDIEHYAHLRRTGSPPEMRISRQGAGDTDRAPTEAPGLDSPHGSG